MNSTARTTSVVTAAIALSVTIAAAVGPAIAIADETGAVAHPLGSQAQIVNGDVVQGWTIRDLKPTTDAIPYSPMGTVWEATASDTAIHGTVIPIVSNLNARARNGDTYRVLFGVATPQGVNPATLGQGQTTSGKVYFDVTGAPPDSVTYNTGDADSVVWITPPPAPTNPRAGTPQGQRITAPAAASPTAGPLTAPAANAVPPGAPGGQPLVPGTAPAAGSVGTPLPADTTPSPTGATAPAPVPSSAGTPLQPGETPATPSPVPASPAAPPSGAAGQPVSSGTQIPADGQRTPVSTPTTTVAPAP